MRDRALLESAIAAPQASFGGQPLIADPVEVAAAYLFYLCRNRPVVDDNKRTPLAASLVFGQINGLLPDPDAPGRNVDAGERLALDVARSALDREATTAMLKSLLAPALKS